MMFRALWIWQRWIGVWRPKLRRIALASAFEPSMMNKRGTAGSRPRSIRSSINACTTGAVLGCPFHQPKRVLEALAIDSERRHQHQMLTDVDAVDLHHHDVEPGQVRTQPFLHACSRQRHEVPRSRRLRHAGPRRRRNIALGKPHRAAEFPRRDVDQHQVHRPLAEPVLRDRTIPTRQQKLLAPKTAHTRPLNRYLAGMKANLALGSAPAVSSPSLTADVASPTSLLSILL